jgi:DNA-binding NtrC family response regulator/pSer/pThr/pTyr-binding forkhead associated (FHA) protein
MNWELVLLEGEEPRRDLEHGFSIGRGDRCSWPIDDGSMSRVHARFDALGKRFFVRDLHSSNGVYLNGERVREMEVFPGDRLILGEKIFLVSGGAQTTLVVVDEEGPALELPLPDDGWVAGGWRNLSRQLLKALEFLNPRASLVGVVNVGVTMVNEIVTEKKEIKLSSWILDELKRGPLLVNQEEIISARESLMARKISSIMAFPLGAGAFVYLEKAQGKWSEKEFAKVKELLIEFKVMFVTALKSWAERESLSVIQSKDKNYQKVLSQARKAAEQNVNTVIQGPPGSGKSLLAKWLHEWSDRNDEKRVSIDLSLLPSELLNSALLGHEKGAFTGADQKRDGYLFMAHRGTLILENFDESSEAVQTLLLKILEDGEYSRLGSTEKLPLDLQLIVTSRKNLKELSRSGGFREDLYFRLAVLEMQIPSLDQRSVDIELVAQSLIAELALAQGRKDLSFDKEFVKSLHKRLWPGNLRELKNFLERALVESPDKDILSLKNIESTDQIFPSLKELEKEHILKALQRCKWNKGQCCELLGITRPTLAKKIADHNLEKAD